MMDSINIVTAAILITLLIVILPVYAASVVKLIVTAAMTAYFETYQKYNKKG